MIKVSGNYPLDGIKYFYPNIGPFEFLCPKCKTILISDCDTEYPKKDDTWYCWCDTCEDDIEIKVKIKLTATLEFDLEASKKGLEDGEV